jgi:shikimate dehydrogenase
MKLLGLIGYPLTHSFSKRFFAEKFEKEGISGWEYDLYPIQDINELPRLISATPALAGLNVTIPYKQSVIPLLGQLAEDARLVGAVNTIKIDRTKRKLELTGYNTDTYGFEKSLEPLLKSYHISALVLGTGGASKAVQYVLSKLGIDHTLISRKKGGDILSYVDITPELVSANKLIINTTPLGMFPNVREYPPIPYVALGDRHILYDLVYNPEETEFLKKGRAQGATVKNGLEMLHLQAEKAWEIWTASA